jgi:hypothetical protein
MHLDTYSANFFIPNFFFLSGLGAGTVPKALTGAASPAKGRVCFGGATVMVTIELRPTAGGDCPGAAPAESDNGSTMVEGMLCTLSKESGIQWPSGRTFENRLSMASNAELLIPYKHFI